MEANEVLHNSTAAASVSDKTALNRLVQVILKTHPQHCVQQNVYLYLYRIFSWNTFSDNPGSWQL